MTPIIEATLSDFQAEFERHACPVEEFLEQRELSRLSESDLRLLTIALVRLEIELGRKSGLSLTVDNYARRFADLSPGEKTVIPQRSHRRH